MHDEEGSLAFILNHPLPFFIDVEDFSVSDEQGEGRFPLYRGGPVGTEQCFFLMKSDHPPKDSTPVVEDIHLGSTPGALKDFSSNRELHDGVIRFFLGYAGWSFFQLDCELSNNWWFTLGNRAQTAFAPKTDGLWLSMLNELGPHFHEQGKSFIESDLGA